MTDPRDIKQIPSYMMANMKRYVYDHEPVGDFLTAIITNNLCEAFRRADTHNVLIIHAYIVWFWNWAPSTCWGSVEKMEAWLDGSWQSE